MTRQGDVKAEEATRTRRLRVTQVLDGGLCEAVERSGGILYGLNVRIDSYEVLGVLKARFPSGAMVAFVGSETFAGMLIKAAREAGTDKLRWRVDKWAKPEVDED